MKRAWQVWTVFAVCAALLVGVLGWMSWQLMALDRAQARAQQLAAFEENVRLALWRMDSRLGALVARENARPYFVYQAFYPAERGYTRMFDPVDPATPLVASPLLNERPSFVRLHFQVAPDGALSSPQAPTGEWRTLALREADGGVSSASFQAQAQALERLSNGLQRARLLASLPAPEPTQALADRLLARGPDGSGPNQAAPVPLALAQAPVERAVPPVNQAESQLLQQTGPLAQQTEQVMEVNQAVQRARNAQEFSRRARDTQANLAASAQSRNAYAQTKQTRLRQEPNAQAKPAVGKVRRDPIEAPRDPKPETEPTSGPAAPEPAASEPEQAAAAPGEEVSLAEGMLQPLWQDDTLLLARQVRLKDATYVQGCVLDWPGLARALVRDVRDLLPAARLEPVRSQAAPRTPERLLAALPLRLRPGEPAAPAHQRASPLRLTVYIAWAGVVFAILAAGALLYGALALSERRAAFVSAVTHELRTPLTTFRMYAEMLSEGMVAPDKRKGYLDTLCREANRLGHLVENVLAYARLERGKSRRSLEAVPLGALVERAADRLRDRAQQSGMELVAHVPADTGAVRVRAEGTAVEQILFNLVDNACKYAARSADHRIHLELAAALPRARIRVRDHGPGVAADEARRIFQPFSKSARDAAESAPGVGLGLALCRRLARAMGGELVLVPADGGGACFELRLAGV